MIHSKKSLSLILFFALTILACQVFSPQPTREPTVQPTDTLPSPKSIATAEPPTETSPATETTEPIATATEAVIENTATLPPTEPPAPTPTPCSEEICFLSGYLMLQQPIDTGNQNRIDYTSRFGSYRAGSDSASRGVYYLISTGTAVMAVANGTVVVAGDDSVTSYGRGTNNYGNLVILQHQIPGISEPVFSLYGHLSLVSVQVGDTVQAGEKIGEVGSSGNINGSSLLLEVRVGSMDLPDARNPELWLAPLSPNAGAIAGRVVDSSGNYVTIDNIVVERLAGQGQPALDQYYLKTYTKDTLIGLSPFQESFALGELPPGQYQITFYMNTFIQMVVEVKPGEVTRVTFTLP